ncbi:hypothetical protein WBG99_26010 [Streptomyces sp. TG1A-60]|uniref:hypothetical protein n=1 Tax=Streptomyces sp. TG1A-60 TaxID=3129111 RepID=UPI0030CFBB27
MPLLFLNERSCGTGCDPARAERAMTGLAEAVLAVLLADRPGTVLVSREPITGLQIADGHPIGKWHGAPRNKELWQRLLLMQSKWPYRTVFPEGESYFDVEYRHRGETVDGLGAAHLMDGLGVSLLVDACWSEHQLTLEREQLVENDDGESDESETSEVSVRHMAEQDHFEAHRAWIKDGVEAVRRGGLNAVRRGEELWEGRASLFPHLRFLPRVEADLRQLREAWVRPLGIRLAELDQTVAAWNPATEPDGPQWRSKITPEGQNRRKLCVFEDFDGRSRHFDTHARFTPGPGRVYFRVVAEPKTLHVAHVGLKIGI